MNTVVTFSAATIGLLLITFGVCFWKWKLFPKLTPYFLLIGAFILAGTVIFNVLSRHLTSLFNWVGKASNPWVSGGTATVMLCVSAGLLVYLIHGMHPKKGKFNRGHNVAALVAPVVWITSWGVIAAFGAWLTGYIGNLPAFAIGA